MKLPSECSAFSLNFQKRRYDWCIKYLPSDRRITAVDIGAHVGFWSNYMAKDFEKVYSFEPCKRNFECLLENKKNNVIAYNFALGHEKGDGQLSTGKISNSGSWSFKYKGKITHSETVQIKTLDSLNITPNFIKIDVEKYELDVLKGATDTLKKCSPVVNLEAKTGEQRDTIEKFMTKLGYLMKGTFSKECVFVRRPKYSGWKDKRVR